MATIGRRYFLNISDRIRDIDSIRAQLRAIIRWANQPVLTEGAHDGIVTVDITGRVISFETPYGPFSGTTTAGGDLVVTHGLSFTPSAIFTQITVPHTGANNIDATITAISATTFTIHFRVIAGTSSLIAVAGYWEARA